MNIKTVFAIGTLALFFSCTEKKNKYYLVTKRSQQSLTGSGYERARDLDSVEVESDSAAFWQGVIKYTAELKTEKLLNDKGVDNTPFKTLDFDVLDQDKRSILTKIPVSMHEKALAFIEKNK